MCLYVLLNVYDVCVCVRTRYSVYLRLQIRDTPPEGEIFVFGAYLWGCNLERTAYIEFHDAPPRQQSAVPLPLLHFALATQKSSDSIPCGSAKGEKPKANMTYQCPGFSSHRARKNLGTQKELFQLIVLNSDVTPLKWAVRNISCTLRPF